MEFKAHGGGKLPKKSHSLFFHKEKLEIEKKIAWFMSFYKEAHVLSFFFRQKCVLLLGEKEEVLCTFCFLASFFSLVLLLCFHLVRSFFSTAELYWSWTSRFLFQLPFMHGVPLD